MPLIDSPRLTGADQAHWDRLERYDRALAADPRYSQLEAAAVDAVGRFHAADPDWVAAVSWGKDSVCAAHIAALAVPDCRVVWARAADVETPECCDVRDRFLELHPTVRYEERLFEFRVPLRFESGWSTAASQDALSEVMPGRHVSGLRGEESAKRRRSVGVHGIVTRNRCRPLANWTAVDVFAYLARCGLPVHPVYAMTAGGGYDRRLLRVHALGTAPPWGSLDVEAQMLPDDWDMRYYGDVIAAAKAARAG